MDASFQHSAKQVSSYARDPATTGGLGYFAEQKRYTDFILSRTDQADISNCSGFNALSLVNRLMTGRRVSALASFSCVHEFFLTGGTVDLFKGERSAFLYFLFLKLLTVV